MLPDLYPKLHQEILDRLGWTSCAECDNPAEYLHGKDNNALWGFGSDGAPATPLDLLAKVGRASREQGTEECKQIAVPSCGRHLRRLMVAEATSDPRIRIRRLRMTALQQYGPDCDQCGVDLTDQIHAARLCLALGYEDFWAENGAGSWAAKYELLDELRWPRGLCVVRCIQCTGKVTQSQRTPAKLSLRDRTLSGYGGHCVKCGSDQAESLWVVRISGPTLRHPGSGRKMAAAAKYRWLIDAGFPNSHVLMCPDCWADSRAGAGNGYEETR